MQINGTHRKVGELVNASIIYLQASFKNSIIPIILELVDSDRRTGLMHALHSLKLMTFGSKSIQFVTSMTND